MNAVERSAGPRTWVTVVLAVVILVPALLGFGQKFVEFLALIGDAEGAFAVMPVLNYLLMSFGFLLLFVWAMTHGMFRNVEGPKFTMLDNEAKLDAEERRLREEQETEREEGWRHGDA
jgi:hypothetical protein